MTILHPGSNTAVFTPDEIRKLIMTIPKNINRERFEALLFTGCRYTELLEVHNKLDRLQENTLKVKNTKAFADTRFRFVQLNNPGRRAVEYYLRSKEPLPGYISWWENMKRWCTLAGINPEGVGVKSTRKTWESWLVTTYPHEIERIFLSQGHSRTIALKHYLTFPFSKQDKEDMLFYVDGW